MVMEIPLTKGQVTLVDDEDYEELSEHKWQVYKGPKNRTFYAVRGVKIGTKQTTERMHRRLMGFPKGLQVDHRDENGLNNTRRNLRVATGPENHRNVGTRNDNTTGYKGVSYHKATGKYRAYIQTNMQLQHIGLFLTPEDAYQAYCEAAIRLHGEFANVGKDIGECLSAG